MNKIPLMKSMNRSSKFISQIVAVISPHRNRYLSANISTQTTVLEETCTNICTAKKRAESPGQVMHTLTALGLWSLVLSSILLIGPGRSGQAFAQIMNVEAVVTTDNAYSFGWGTVAGILQVNWWGNFINTSAGAITNCSSTLSGLNNTNGPENFSPLNPTIDDFLYIIAWSDDSTRQGALGQFTDGGSSNIAFTGVSPLWEVYATGEDFDTLSGPNSSPSLAVINNAITTANSNTGPANSSGGWVGAAGGPTGTRGNLVVGDPNMDLLNGNVFPIACQSTSSPNWISPVARWMWYNDDQLGLSDAAVFDNQPNPNLNNGKFSTVGNGGQREFLIFRLPVTALTTGCDLQVEKAFSGDPTIANSFFLTLTVTNVGGADCPGLTTLNDDILSEYGSPDYGALLPLSTGTNGIIFNCTGSPPFGATLASFSCGTNDTFQAGDESILTIPVQVVQDGGLPDCVTLTNADDTNPDNNSSCINTQICAIKFNDLDGDGVQNANGSEPFLANWEFNITPTPAASPATLTTDASGAACFNVSAPGAYSVTEVPQGGWVATTPTTQTVNISGPEGEVIYFGNRTETDIPFACDPSLYMSQGDTGNTGNNPPYEREIVQLNPSNLSAIPTVVGNTSNFIDSAGTTIQGNVSINGIAHSFMDGAIYAISEHPFGTSVPSPFNNTASQAQAQHIYKIMKSSNVGELNLYDLGTPIVIPGSASVNTLSGQYVGGTMVLLDELNLALTNDPAIAPAIPSFNSNNMESLMVVSAMAQYGADSAWSSPLWPWQSHLFILAVEDSHRSSNGEPYIIAGPIYILDSAGKPLSGLYDIAYNPADNMIYGQISTSVSSAGQVVRIDLANVTQLSGGRWEVVAEALTTNTSPFLSVTGAAFFNGTSELLLYGVSSGGGSQDQLFSATSLDIDPVVLSKIGLTTGPFGASDGTSCAFAPSFTKTVSPSPTVPGGTATYTYTIVNNQTSDFTVDFFDDSFDNYLTVTGVAGISGATATISNGPPDSVSIPGIVVPANSSVTFTVTVEVDSSLVSSTWQQETWTVENQATLTGVSGFPVGTLLSDEPDIPGFENPTLLDIVVDPPTINLSKEALNTPWQAGGTGTFSITVDVPSDFPAGQSLAIQDLVLSAGFTYVSASLHPTDWSCNGNPGTCYLDGPITAGTYELTFDVQVPGECATYTNCADVDITDTYVDLDGNGVADPWPGFESEGQSCVDVAVTGCDVCTPAPLTIEKTHSPSSFINGGTGTITIKVTNTGSSPVIAPIQVNDTLPAGLTMPEGPFSPTADIACLAGPQSPPPQQINCSYMGNSGGDFSFDLLVNVATEANEVVNYAAVMKGCCGEGPNDTTEDTIPIHGQETGSICGKKYDDNDQPLSGWVITATATGTTAPIYYSSPTNADGKYCINPLLQGTYTVSEQIPILSTVFWTPVSPVSGSYLGVLVGPGTSIDIDFVNKRNKYGPVGELPVVLSVPVLGPVTKQHSPDTFSTGAKGTFTIKVNNKGKKLKKGMLSVVDYMPPGLTVKTGAFRTGSWACKGGKVSSSGQDVTCTYNKRLRKNERAKKLKLSTKVAPLGEFPVDVEEVENCATASVQGAAGVKVCDKVRIIHKKTKSIFDLPITIGIGIGIGTSKGGKVKPDRPDRPDKKSPGGR